jgi:hypothetical protein
MKRNKVFQIKKIFKANKKFKNKISNIPIKILKIQIHLSKTKRFNSLTFNFTLLTSLPLYFKKIWNQNKG